MRLLLSVALVLATALSAENSSAQPQHGDFVLTYMSTGTLVPGGMLWRDQGGTTTWNTIFQTAPNAAASPWKCKMAADNRDLVTALNVNSTSNWHLLSVDVASGVRTTLSTFANGVALDFHLDHDDTWIACGYWPVVGPPLEWDNHVWAISRTASNPHRIKILFNHLSPTGRAYGMTIDRERSTLSAPTYPYAISLHQSNAAYDPKILWADRTGVIKAFGGGGSSLTRVTAIEVDPLTGGYVTFSGSTNGDICFVSRDGSSITTMGTKTFGVLEARVLQDGTFWFLENRGSAPTPRRLVHMDRTGSVTSIVPVPVSRDILGFDLYGSRMLVCSGMGNPGSRGVVKLQNLKPANRGKDYWLAASFGRRPAGSTSCLRFANGEYLFLDQTGPLFRTSMLGLAPTLFLNFRGTVDKQGNATAWVDFPKSLPSGLGVAVFVAGIIYDPKNNNQILEVTNTHWFVLN